MKVVRVFIPRSVNNMPDEILCMIFDRIDFPEKFKLRGVCHQWKTVLEDWLAGRQYVRINFKEPDAVCGQAHCALKCAVKNVGATVRSACQYPNCDNCQKARQENTNQYRPKLPTCTEWSPKPSVRAFEFAQTWVEPKMSVCSITVHRFNHEMAIAFGHLFANLKVLLIYFDIQDTESNIANIVQLLSNCTLLDNFAFIMSTQLGNSTTMPAICEAVNKSTMSTLKRLDLFVSDLISNEPIDCALAVDLSNCITQLAHFGIPFITFISQVYLNMVRMISINKRAYRANPRIAANQDSLSIHAVFWPESSKDLLKVNPEFRHVKRLQLTSISNRDWAVASLFQFWRIESLLLSYYRPTMGTFDEFWIKTLCQMNRLTELTLIDFALPGLPILPQNPIPTHPHLPKVKKLTIGAFDLLTRFKENCENNIVDVDYFGYIINYIFPRLEEITVLAGESNNHTFEDECLNTLSGRMVKMFSEKCPTIKRITVELGNEAFVNSKILFQKNLQRLREINEALAAKVN